MATLESLDTLIREKFKNNEKEHADITDHLKKLNGQVKDNTTFRNKFTGGMTVIKIIGVVNIVAMVAFWFSIIIK